MSEKQIKFLSLDWFKSKIEKVTESSIEKVVSKKLENLVEQLENETVVEEYVKPYLNSFTINENFIVILNDGKQLVKFGATEELVNKVKSAKSEAEVIELMSSEEVKKEKEEVKKQEEEIKLIQNNFDVLVETGDFEVRDNSVYMVGINRSLPKLLVNRFAEVVNRLKKDYEGCWADNLLDIDVEYQSLIRFWKKCCLNPNAQSAEDLYEFLENHNMKIDQHGNFYAYRRVKSVGNDSKELVDFISNAYNKVKAVWKKSTKNFKVVTIPNSNVFELKPFSFNVEDTDYVCLGDLEFLYLNLPNMKENRYTSAHTGREDYRVGNIISMPRNEGDDDNSVNCSQGFHAASKAYDYSGFGDQDILVIISPSDVLAVPHGEVGKLRTCRWFFAMTLDKNERFILDEDCFDVTHLGDVFEAKLLEDLEEHTQQSFTEEVKRHTFTLPSISTKEITNIVKSLSEIKEELGQRVVELH